MMIPQDCDGCRYFNSNIVTDGNPCYDCVYAHYGEALSMKYEPITNGDKIRKMSDAELAEFLSGVADGVQQFSVCEDECSNCGADTEVCRKMCEEWLKRPAY